MLNLEFERPHSRLYNADMDRITKALLEDFILEQQLQSLEESKAFERFCNFCVVSKEYSETFAVEEVSCGGGQDTGIDGIAIVINGTLVSSVEEIEDLCEMNGYLDATFIFVQSKTASAFNASDIGTFFFGVKDFFSESPRLRRNEFISEMDTLQQYIYSRSGLMHKGKPMCKLYYVTTGTWKNDEHLMSRIEAERSDVKDTRLFRDVVFEPIDADGIQSLYRDTNSKVMADFTFTNKTVLPDIDGVKEAYLGVLPASDYVRLITDEMGNIRKSLFYDNVRDFQDYNDVNKEIQVTLQSAHKDRFAILNNGVTLVARTLHTVGNRFHIEDYQIVNGCQTSHVLYNEREALTPGIHVPIKVVATSDDGITNEVIKATNRQTQVKSEELNALTDFEKKLETFYGTYEGKQRLYYERRSKQYSGVLGVEKVRIVTRTNQIKASASMFIDEPHRAGRYYGTLLKLIGERLFLENHHPLPYYMSAFAHYRLEYLFRSGSLAPEFKPFRYHLLMILRYQLGGASMPPLSSNKIEPYCERILNVLLDDDKTFEAYINAAGVIYNMTGNIENLANYNRDAVKTATFTEQVRDAISIRSEIEEQ